MRTASLLLSLVILFLVGCGGGSPARTADAGTDVRTRDDCGSSLVSHQVEIFPPRGSEGSTTRQDIDLVGPSASVVAVRLVLYVNNGSSGWVLYSAVAQDFRSGSPFQTRFLRCIQEAYGHITALVLSIHRPRNPGVRLALRATVDTIDENDLNIGGESVNGEVRCEQDLPLRCGRTGNGDCGGRLVTFVVNEGGQTSSVCAYELPWGAN